MTATIIKFPKRKRLPKVACVCTVCGALEHVDMDPEREISEGNEPTWCDRCCHYGVVYDGDWEVKHASHI